MENLGVVWGDTEHRVWSDEGRGGTGLGLGPGVSGSRAGWLGWVLCEGKLCGGEN